MNSDEYHYLHECGADYVTVFQKLTIQISMKHFIWPDINEFFPYRLNAQERALKGGKWCWFLLHFWDWMISVKDAFANGYHARLLQRKYPMLRLYFPARDCVRSLTHDRINPMDVHEPQLLQVVCAYRLFMPFASITVSTRECEEFVTIWLILRQPKFPPGLVQVLEAM